MPIRIRTARPVIPVAMTIVFEVLLANAMAPFSLRQPDPRPNTLLFRRQIAGSPSPAVATTGLPDRKPSGDWRRESGSHGSVKLSRMRNGTNILPGRPCRQGEGLGKTDA